MAEANYKSRGCRLDYLVSYGVLRNCRLMSVVLGN